LLTLTGEGIAGIGSHLGVEGVDLGFQALGDGVQERVYGRDHPSPKLVGFRGGFGGRVSPTGFRPGY
jgi:hypothetical protein